MRKLLLFIFVITFSLPSFAEDAQSSDTPDLEQAEQNYKLAQEKEKAGRATSAIATGATSYGAITALGAMSEQRIDAESETDMAAYLGTIKCNYSGGQTVRGGNTDIEIPGGNELLAYYTEYKNTATNLKNTKTALNLPSGLESQTVYDKAETNLYKNASIGRGAGGYTSLARALGDTNSADAAAWAAQKAESAENIKTGALIAAGGLALGIGTNVALTESPTSPGQNNLQSGAHGRVVGVTSISNDLLFAEGSADLLPGGKTLLYNDLYYSLNSRPNATIGITITGHTDKTPVKPNENYKDNLELSQKRAQNVQTYLESTDLKRLTNIKYESKGLGDSECQQSGNQPECCRIEITLTDETEETNAAEQ